MSKITNGSYTIYYSEERGLVNVDKLGNVSMVAQDPNELGVINKYELGHILDNPDDYRLATKEDINDLGCIYLDETLHRPFKTKDCRECPDRYICLLSEVAYPYFRKYSINDYSDYDVFAELEDLETIMGPEWVADIIAQASFEE